MVLKLRKEAPGQWEEAKCAKVPVSANYDPFFSEDESETTEAVDFCNGTQDGIVCPVRHDCLIFALTNNEKYGIWGGTTEVTRKAIRRKFPPIKGKPRDEWVWMTQEQALRDLRPESLPNREDEG